MTHAKRGTEAERLLSALVDWFDDDHRPVEDVGELVCSADGLPWPCAVADAVAFFDTTGQCARCYRVAGWREPDGALICETCRARIGLAKRHATPLVEQLDLGLDAPRVPVEPKERK